MNLLYLGSKLKKRKKMQSAMETMTDFFQEFANVRSASDHSSLILKAVDLILTLSRNAKWANVVLIDLFSTRSFYLSLLLCANCKLFHLSYFLVLRGGALPSRYRSNPRLCKWMFDNSSKIIAPSNYLLSYFSSFGFELTYIPNIINESLYDYKLRQPIKPSILYLRGFGKVYNPLMLVKAVNRLKDIEDLNVLMLGGEHEHHYGAVMDEIKLNNLEGIISVKQKMTREEWIRISSEYSFMVSCPDVDNTPTSLIEGMALGMCVITTKVGGVPYLVNSEEVFFVEKNNHEELATTLEHLLSDSWEYERKVQQARSKAEGFSWAMVKPQWQKIFDDIIKSL